GKGREKRLIFFSFIKKPVTYHDGLFYFIITYYFQHVTLYLRIVFYPYQFIFLYMDLFNVYPINPINIVISKGSSVWDASGTEYLDLYGGHAVISIGHGHPHYVESITNQLHQIGFYSNSVEIPLQRQLARQLGEISGKDDYALFLCNSGAEANENALKLASFHNGRKKIIAFTKSFHGRTSLAVAATDNPAIVAPVNQTDNVVFLPFNDEEALTRAFQDFGEEISS